MPATTADCTIINDNTVLEDFLSLLTVWNRGFGVNRDSLDRERLEAGSERADLPIQPLFRPVLSRERND